MRKPFIIPMLLAVLGLSAAPAPAQLGGLINKAKKIKQGAEIYQTWSPEQESVIGEASAAKMVNIFGLYQNPDMVKYVNLVGNAVARQAPRDVPYHFAILDSEAITALSLPGGYIFVTRGALANISNEAELAGVLGHEVAHVDGRHLEKEMRTQKSAQFAKSEAAEHVPSGAELINLAGQVVTSALTLKVSRDKELEADRNGMRWSSKAGYDPHGLPNFLEVLARASAAPENKRALGLWGSTHPPFGERVAALNALIPSLPPGGQTLPDRFNKFVNQQEFAKQFSLAPGGGSEVDGVVSKGVVVLVGGQLPEGTRVKVRVSP
jgi:beta-barrel assembly-enhancing protease